jgi:selenocysteine lyase/cysteine desulfurase
MPVRRPGVFPPIVFGRWKGSGLSFFRQHTERANSISAAADDFGYLPPDVCYFDSACQTLRPQPVITAITDYYYRYNACGGRVKYAWGEKVDSQVADVRAQLLDLAGKPAKDFTVAFCLNTTSGINLILQQLPEGRYRRIVTSDIEHNSVFIPTQTCARRLHLERLVLPRLPGGALAFRSSDLEKAVVVVNTTSNIDGRVLENARELADMTHRRGGKLVIDAAQTMGHDPRSLRHIDFDALCGSSHKMYGPSLGFIVIRKSFLRELDCYFTGGGTVSDVRRDDCDLLDSPDEAFAALEPGLQDFAGIVGLGAAIRWQRQRRTTHGSNHGSNHGANHDSNPNDACALVLYGALAANTRLKLINTAPSPIISFFAERVDAHRLALYLSGQNIMVRSGHFCCHYFLKQVANLPPLVRISIGLHNTPAQAMHVAAVIDRIVSNL